MAARGRYIGALWCWKMKTFSIGAPSVDEEDVCWVRTLVLVQMHFDLWRRDT
jgi:hypothetical protein